MQTTFSSIRNRVSISINFHIPSAWTELSDKQLRYVYQLLAAEYATDEVHNFVETATSYGLIISIRMKPCGSVSGPQIWSGGGILLILQNGGHLRVFAKNIDDMATALFDYQISTGATIREALGRLNSLPGGKMTLFVTDCNGKAVGSLTDGDIRRGLLTGKTVESAVNEVMHIGFCALRPGDDPFVRVAEWKRRGIAVVPRLDCNDKIEELLDLTSLDAIIPVEAVLMAGGRGERLRPLTADTPKPLLPIAGKPIIDYNVETLRRYGVNRIYVTVNYLRDKITEHFAGSEAVCVAEPKRMGTFGSVSLIPKPVQPDILVMNSDLLTDINLAGMYARHLETSAALTMAVIPYTVNVPFAIVERDGERVTGLREKPVYNYFANAGVYILKSELISLIEPDSYLDAPDFVENLIASGRKISYYPIEGMWIDIGSPDDYRRADEMMRAAKKA